jgi:carbamoyltransferase
VPGPRFAALLDAFRQRTGCPVLVNTSFNLAGEPIVCSPVDALFTLAGSEIDCLVLEDFLIDRDMLPDSWPSLLPCWERRAPQAGGIAEDLYTFV